MDRSICLAIQRKDNFENLAFLRRKYFCKIRTEEDFFADSIFLLSRRQPAVDQPVDFGQQIIFPIGIGLQATSASAPLVGNNDREFVPIHFKVAAIERMDRPVLSALTFSEQLVFVAG